MSNTPRLPRDVHSIALESVVSRIQDSEQQRRRIEATQVTLFAEALDQASPDHFSKVRSITHCGDADSADTGGRKPEAINVEAAPCEDTNRPGHPPAGANVRNTSPRSEILYRSLRAELACALGISERSVDRRLAHAYELNRNYQETYRTLLEGQISIAHTEVIIGAGSIIGLGDDVSTVARRDSYESAVLEHAVRETTARLRPIARRLAERFCDQTIDERHAQARLQRRVWVIDHEDGMSDLSAHLPSAQAHAIYDRLTRASRLLRSAALDDGRKQDELRTDVFSELLLATPNNDPRAFDTHTVDQHPGGRHVEHQHAGDTPTSDAFVANVSATTGTPQATYTNISAQVQIVITDETLFAEQLRVTDDGLDWGAPSSLYPAELVGSGPVDTESARALAVSTSHWELVRTHPETGVVTSVDRYRPSEQMRRMLRARDLHCRFYGCRAPAYRCDIDHTIDAAKGGPTSTDNLAHLCRGHHTLKHHGDWSVSQNKDGVMHWRSPTGRSYADRPPSRVRFTSTPTNVETYRLDSVSNIDRLATAPF